MSTPIQPMKTNRATCPFTDEGWTCVRLLLEGRVFIATPICHSTGKSALVNRKKRVSQKELACRGARNLQLEAFYNMGFLDAPTDEAWSRKVEELKLNG